MSRRRRPRAAVGSDTAFWGTPPPDDAEVHHITPTPEPGALVRSLGPPKVGMNEKALAVVYEEIVRAATALAAASGLLDTDGD